MRAGERHRDGEQQRGEAGEAADHRRQHALRVVAGEGMSLESASASFMGSSLTFSHRRASKS
ncbi:MAG: hypothetical protein WDN72_07265 [Alphaproteobacteria bacterium]